VIRDSGQPSLREPWVWGPVLAALIGLMLVLTTDTNRQLFLVLNRLSLYSGETLWSYLTLLGDTMVLLTLLLVWVRRRPELVWAAFLALMLASLWVQGVKLVVEAPRPVVVLAPASFHMIGPRLSSFSMPSGHTADIFAFAGVVALLSSRRLVRWLLLCGALAVSVSRCVVGAHWPLDLLAGMLGGWLSAVAGLWWSARWGWGVLPAGRLILAVALLAAAAGLLCFYNTGYGRALVLEQLIAAGCLAVGLWEVWSARYDLKRADSA